MKIRKLTLAMLAMLALSLPACGDKEVDEPAPKPNPGTEQPDTPDTPGTTDTPVVLEIPDKDGASIKGVVYCDNKPLANVVVSDGDEVVTTDEQGRYYINSTKKHSSVFVTIPSGYFVKTDGVWPQFYGSLTKNASTVEQVNFELVSNDKSDYVVIGLADLHITHDGVRKCLTQFESGYLPDLNTTINEYKAAGKNVYCITLGDESHDLYWYEAGGKVDLGGTKPYYSRIEATAIFHTMGNHDNDPYVADDFGAEHKFRSVYGPTHYSFNLGEVHYIVLDDIVYTNAGGAQGKLGDREYEQRVTPEQLEWLRKDLSHVDKTTPVVLCMHAPLWKNAILPSKSQTPSLRQHITNAAALINFLSGYRVTVLSGHAHINSCNRDGNIVEYNIGSGAGRLWESGSLGSNHLCGDGSVGGYYVMEMNGKYYQAYYKSMGYDRNYQFRTYDLNRCHITAAKYCPKSSDKLIEAYLEKYVKGYDSERTDNKVHINVFGFNDKWSIKVTENGQELKTTRINAYDPLWTISVPCKILDSRKEPTSGKMPTQTSHFFECQASSATSTLKIEVTDEWGRKYTETMTRPKDLTLDMK